MQRNIHSFHFYFGYFFMMSYIKKLNSEKIKDYLVTSKSSSSFFLRALNIEKDRLNIEILF